MTAPEGEAAEGPASGAPQAPDARLAAERAEADHWRRVARQRAAALDALKRRPLVRAALAADRRLEPVRARARATAHGARRRVARAGLSAAALTGRDDARQRRVDLDARVAALPAPEPDARTVLVIAAGRRAAPLPFTPRNGRTTVVEAASGADVEAAVAGASADLVCVVGPNTEPLGPGWLDRLAAAVAGPVVAATPLAVHPARPVGTATPHDGAVRSAGLGIEVVDGVPLALAREAGHEADPDRDPIEVVAPSGAAVLLDRAALVAAGGLQPTGDADATALALGCRLRQNGGRVACVPGAVVVDHRPVVDRDALTHPVDQAGSAWRRVVERHGPALVRLGRPAPNGRLDFVLTVAAPSHKVAERWGDWHLAGALAAALERAGHVAAVQPSDGADTLRARSADVHLVVRGLQRVRPTPGQRQVLWIISHPEDIDDDELRDADLVLVASERFAAELGTRTSTPVEVLLQATDPERFSPRPVDPRHEHPVTIVAKSRDVLRPMVADALAAGLRPAIYGSGWEGLVDPTLVVSGYVPNRDLPVVYASAGVVLNDHWGTMAAWGFVSNRIFDVAACGTPVVSDHLPEIPALFGDLVPTWRTPAELGEIVTALRTDPEGTQERVDRLRRLVLDHHTFDHRAADLLDALARRATPPS